MVGPEPDQALAERRRGGDGVGQLRGGLGLEQRGGTRLAGRRFCRTVFTQRREACRRGRRVVEAGWIRLVKLLAQPGRGIGWQRFGAAAAEPETHESLSGASVHAGDFTRLACVGV